jgi:DNA helicase-2/ATP-dependent DNA helicase PcrA
VLSNRADDIATILELVGAAFRARGNQSALLKWEKTRIYANRCRAGQIPTFNIVSAASTLVTAAYIRKYSGDPSRDWVTIKSDMRQIGETSFKEIASSLDYLDAFSRGRGIRDSLSKLWMQNASYVGAREALDSAFGNEQLFSSGDELRGIHVMNMHKSKGKQFDGVVLYRQQHNSPFVWRGEGPPHAVSRRLLHMAITRARTHVLILDEAYSKCPIIDAHTL